MFFHLTLEVNVMLYQAQTGYKEWLLSTLLPETIMQLKAAKFLYQGKGTQTQYHVLPSVESYDFHGKTCWTLRVRPVSDVEQFWVISRFSPTRWALRFFESEFCHYPSTLRVQPRKQYRSLEEAIEAAHEAVRLHRVPKVIGSCKHCYTDLVGDYADGDCAYNAGRHELA